MAAITRIPITNIHLGNDYSGRILVGPHKKPMNVLLDTGSSALALDGDRYKPDTSGGDQLTQLAQAEAYGDKSNWTGAVIKTSVAVGEGDHQVTAEGVNLAVAYEHSADMFSPVDGILGLAYAELDDAFEMPELTWPKRYKASKVGTGKHTTLTPYLTQLAEQGVVSDKISFYTLRSLTHKGSGGANDPLNNGWMIIGGGEESTDLYTGPFQSVKVLTDEWYNTHLKAIIVGESEPIHVRARGSIGNPSNSIVDSGTNTLDLGPSLLKAVLSRFDPTLRALLTTSIKGQRVSMSKLKLESWPALTFILQGDGGDVSLRVSPNEYWQVNSPRVGAAMAAISKGEEGFTILGLPLMNGYLTIFDGEADSGRGVIKFASVKRP